MPRRDGTGPEGYGPMTGRGLGFCAGAYAPHFGWYGPPRRHLRRRWLYQTPPENRSERQILEDEHRLLEEELKEIKERLETLGKE